MFLIVPIILLGSLLALVFHYWREFSRELDDFTRAWFLRWLRAGVAIPIVVWMLMNVGSMPLMPPLTRQIAHLQAGGSPIHALAMQTALAAYVIVSCWSALTMGWFLTGLFKRARNTDDLVLAAIVWSPVLLVIFWLFGDFFGWSAVGFAVFFWIWPLTQYCLNEAQTAKPSPSYSAAIGKIKFGKYSEAEMEIISELENCETDFDGWMMLAELYANQFRDLAEAEKTILDLCEEPNTTLPQVSIALNRLADWQLTLRNDPVAAARVLEEVCKRMPGTLLALTARNRINQLPRSRAELEEQRIPRKIHLPALSDNFGESASDGAEPVDLSAALALANELVEKLKENPKDVTAREKLARIFAEKLERFDLAVEQLELLAGMPERTPAKAAEWLAQMAAWRIKQYGEGGEAREILERLIREFPQSPQAFAAQRRLNLMAMNAKSRGG